MKFTFVYSIIELRKQDMMFRSEENILKKSQFKKILKREKHPITQGKGYEFIFIVLFILLLAIMIILQKKDVLPSTMSIIIGVLLIILAIPYCVIDIKRDKKIKEMYKYYQKENKILQVEDNSKTLKKVLIIEILCTVLIGSYIVINYGLKEELFNANKLEDVYQIKTNDGEVIETSWYEFDHGQFSLKTPNDFYALDEDMIKRKYPSENPPSYVLSNDKTTINIVINITDNELKNSQIKSYMSSMENQLSDVADIIDTHFFERDGHEIGSIKFVSKAADTDIYNHMIAFSDNGMLRIVSFNCIKELEDNWKNVGDFIINSITFK